LDTLDMETFDLFGQLFAEVEDQSSDAYDPRVMATLRRWVTDGDVLTTTLILRYALWQLAHDRDHDPVPSLVGIRLTGADLDGLQIHSEWECDLTQADFTGAKMRNCILDGCDLTRASFENADLSFSYLLSSQCSTARFDKTILRGTTLRDGDVTGCTFANVDARGLWVIRCSGSMNALGEAPGVAIVPDESVGIGAKVGILHIVGHCGQVWTVAWSPDGAHLASDSDDGSIRIWNTTTGRQTATLITNTDGISSVDWSPDGSRLASGSWDGSVIIWDTTTAQPIRLAGHTGPVWAVAWSPDGAHLASGSPDRSVIIWDTTTGQPTLTLTDQVDSVWSVAWSPDGTHLASGSTDNSIRIWDTESERTHFRFDNLPSWPTADSPNAVTWDDTGTCIWASPNAWRFLVCKIPADGTTPIHALPAEYFGPLPS